MGCLPEGVWFKFCLFVLIDSIFINVSVLGVFNMRGGCVENSIGLGRGAVLSMLFCWGWFILLLFVGERGT